MFVKLKDNPDHCSQILDKNGKKSCKENTCFHGGNINLLMFFAQATTLLKG